MGIHRQFRQLALWSVLSLSCLWSQAALIIGQSADFSGTASATSKEVTDGAQLYFRSVNARGGIHGQAIELRSVDDKLDPALTRQAAKALIQDPAVMALLLVRGTPNVEGLFPLLHEGRIALVSPGTGAMSMHHPVHPWIFNVRASYQTEAERTIQHLSDVGMTRIGVLHVDNSFGVDALGGVKSGMERAQLKPSFIEKFPLKDPDFTALGARIANDSPQCIVFIGAGQSVAQGIATLRSAGYKGQFATLSNNAAVGFITALGPHARGVMVSQVYPNEHTMRSALVAEAMAAAKTIQLTGALTPAMMEGYASAKVLVEGLRRAGPKPTRAKLRDALENLKDYDIGGLKISYDAQDHSGLSFVELSIISNGRFMR